MTRVVFLGPDPLPVLGAGIPAICADDCGLDREAGPGWERVQLSGPQSTPALLERAEVQDQLRASADAIAVWKSSAGLERLAEQLGLGLAASPARVARRLENKSYFSRAAAQAGLPVPDNRSGKAGPELLREATGLGGPWVFQLAQGFSGERSYPARDGAQLEALMTRFRDRPCRVARRVEGTPVTVTGVVGPAGVAVSPACLQLTGIPSLTPHPLGSCGNDYRTPIRPGAELGQLALRVAEWIRQAGHLGIFGLDLVLGPEGRPWCIEVNPRMVASLPLLSLSARDRGGPGLLAAHLACFGIGEWAAPALDCEWSQVILYQRGERRPVAPVRTGQTELGGELVPGRWQPLGLGGPAPDRVAVVVQGSSRAGRELARIIFRGSCLAPGGALLPWIERLTSELRSGLELPIPPGPVS